MAQPYTIRLTAAQVEKLTLSGQRSLRDGIDQLITATDPATIITTTPQTTPNSRTITVTITIND